MNGEDQTGQVPIKVKVSAPPDASPEAVEQLAERLGAAGLQVEDTLTWVGAITGTVDDIATFDTIKAIAGEGVHVEEVRDDFQLPPSDAPVQ